MIKCEFQKGIIYPLEELNIKEGTIYVEIKKDLRTIQQNKYLWKVFNLISEQTGYKVFEVKTLILIEVGHFEIVTSRKTKNKYTVPKETKNLNKKEFSELTENILQWSNERGFDIMTPEDYFTNLNYN